MRTRLIGVLMLVAWSFTSLSAAASAPIVVRDGPGQEFYASMDDGWLAWTSVSQGRGVTWVRHAGEGRWFVAPTVGRLSSRVGSIVLDGPRAGSLWFVRRWEQNANIAWYDLRTHQTHRASSAINTPKPEFSVSVSGDFLAFVRETKGSGFFSGKLILYRFSTKNKRIVAQNQGRTDVRQGQLNGNYLAFVRCQRLCSTYRYRISSDSTRRISGPTSSRAAWPAVLPDGTVYFVRGGNRCGGGVKLKRWRHGRITTIHTFPDWVDVGRLEARMVNGSPMVLFTKIRHHCSASGIYQIAG